jgi:crotonobetainyl-CoA:carnitine CoA-transferase CaiB-like acyl-CoA transferase
MRRVTDLLRGVRVLELCWAWAGPFAARTLADLGAEVIKIEGPARPDGVRFGNYPDNEPGDEPWNRGGHFQKFSRNKHSLVLDLTAPAGRDVFLDLVKVADVFIENNSPRVLPNLGLTGDVLRRANPNLIVVSMPGFGSSGPLRDWAAFGINLEAQCGLSSVTGYPDLGPVRSTIPYGDPIAGLHATVAALAALRHRRATGEARQIEVAQNESLLNVLVEPFFRATVGGDSVGPDGCYHETLCPHNVYPAAEDDTWVALAVEDARQFASLARLIGRPDWADDPTLRSADARKRREPEIDAAIAAWTAGLARDEAVARLNEAGAPAAPTRTIAEVVHDPLLAQRGYWTEIDHPVTGRLPYAYLPWRYRRSEPVTPTHAPLFGEHNRQILEGLLGFPAAVVDDLKSRGVVAARPLMA